MSNHYGWDYWADAVQTEELDGWTIWKKDGYVTECPPGSCPGDRDTLVWKDDPENPYSYFYPLPVGVIED